MHARLSFAILLTIAVTLSTGCRLPATKGLPVNGNLPPAQRLMGPGPGIAGPGPGVMGPQYAPDNAQQQQETRAPIQILFAKPDAMQIRWDVEGNGRFDSTPLIVPGRQNFPQGGMFRLKITNIEGREGIELYPTLEVAWTTPRTGAYLAHNAIPIQFTEEDFDQVLAGNYVTKVIYLPDPEFQELALAGVDTLVSTRLDPGTDPITEADRRGAILAIIRVGNRDEEMPGLNGGGDVSAVGFFQGGPAPAGYAQGSGPVPMPPLPFTGAGTMPNYISGVTAPPWGMPMTGTPIGLPGPPHLPHGFPAGLQKHSIHNFTHQSLPRPTKDLRINVQQTPGMSYPAPVDRVYIKEQMKYPAHRNLQPPSNMSIGRGIPGGRFGLRGGGHQQGCSCPSCQSGGY